MCETPVEVFICRCGINVCWGTDCVDPLEVVDEIWWGCTLNQLVVDGWPISVGSRVDSTDVPNDRSHIEIVMDEASCNHAT